jgi:uncharacterized protein
MRRREKEITCPTEVMGILKRAEILRLGLCHEGNAYIVPMNFGIKGNCIYLHSAPEGRKIDIIKENNRVCFEAECGVKIMGSDKPCKFSMVYQCIMGTGRIYILDNMEDKKEGLDIIMRKYSDKDNFLFEDDTVRRTAVLKIEIEEITGKESKG